MKNKKLLFISALLLTGLSLQAMDDSLTTQPSKETLIYPGTVYVLPKAIDSQSKTENPASFNNVARQLNDVAQAKKAAGESAQDELLRSVLMSQIREIILGSRIEGHVEGHVNLFDHINPLLIVPTLVVRLCKAGAFKCLKTLALYKYQFELDKNNTSDPNHTTFASAENITQFVNAAISSDMINLLVKPRSFTYKMVDAICPYLNFEFSLKDEIFDQDTIGLVNEFAQIVELIGRGIFGQSTINDKISLIELQKKRTEASKLPSFIKDHLTNVISVALKKVTA